ncbi:alpha-galactosidase A [Macrophomina phaseolina]|uniref:Alpha-galactosidase A n=1 Tax=Macrophomina phaseolina TaxID=35725 RepID=A0ABQ8FSI8_9PEZI|nr:alpha-galactosidase A [Macrophomina phaseolina]
MWIQILDYFTKELGKLVILDDFIRVFNEGKSEYRLRIGNRVKYLSIAPATFDRDTLSFPLGSLPLLPYHDDNWTVAHISRGAESGELKTSLSNQKFAGVRSIWHSAQINVLDLERTEQLTGAAFKALISKYAFRGLAAPSVPQLLSSEDKVAVTAKIARFEWEIHRIERETRAYRALLQHGASDIAPRFLGHVHESGHVMGLLLEKLEGQRNASIDDLSGCEAVLGRFHGLGLLHGDANRYNFLVGQDGVRIIDFEHFQENTSEQLRKKEMQSLRNQLLDRSGRGSGFAFGGCEE